MNSAARISYLSNVDENEESSRQIIIEHGNSSRSIKNRHGIAVAIVGMVFVVVCFIIVVYAGVHVNKMGRGKLVY